MRNPACPILFHISIFQFSTVKHGTGCGAICWVTALQAWWVRFPMMSLDFFIDIILPTALWSSSCNRNEYQEYFLGCKGGRCVRLTTLPLSYANCLEMWASQPPETLRVYPGLYRDFFTFTIKHNGEKTSFTYIFMFRNEVFLIAGFVNDSHRTCAIVFTCEVVPHKMEEYTVRKIGTCFHHFI